MQRLNDICFCEVKANSDDEFVGIRCTKSSDCETYKTEIVFPIGYFESDSAIRELSEETLREHLMNLFSVLSDVDLMSKVREDSSIAAMSEEMKTTAYPMLAYLNVIRSYFDNGYITEKEVEYKKKAHGKVNWNRTIKMTRPVVTDDENLVYLDLIARKVSYNEDCLITLVHKFCVHDALKRLGFLFGIEPTEEPILDFDYELFCSAINAKLSKTFNDRDLHLLSDLAKIIEFLAEHQTEDGINSEFTFGVNKFAPMWEAMVDRIFATVSREEKRNKYNPHLKFVAFGSANTDGEKYQDDDNEGTDEEHKRSTLRPDTIMQNGENIFILDSKYYKYGLKGNLCYLPGADSVCKQMAYAEYVERNAVRFGVLNELDNVGEHVFNAFVLPYCVEADNRKLPPDADSETRPFKMRYVGYIYGDWKQVPDAQHPYHKIACILLDVKSVMQDYVASGAECQILADLISSKTSG